MTDSTEQQEVKKFLKHLCIFLIPVVGVLAFPLFVFIASREYVSPEIFATSRPTSIVGMAYSDPATYYKVRAVLTRQPRIIAVGNSRVMQFRGGFFARPEQFFNVGGGNGTLRSFQQFLDQIPEQGQPDIIILCVDQNFFDDNRIKAAPTPPPTDTYESPENIFLNSWLTIYRDYADGKFSIHSLFEPERRERAFGLHAFMSGDGFWNDGAHNYGSFFKSTAASERDGKIKFATDIRNIQEGRDRYSGATSVSASGLSDLATFIDAAAARNIRVVGYVPPIAPTVYRALGEDVHTHFSQLSPAITPLFARHGFTFIDFTDAAAFGILDTEMIDEAHGSDKAFLRIFLKLREQDSGLASVGAPLNTLQALLQNSPDSYHVIPGEISNF